MGTIHLPDELRQIIDRHVAEGHATSESDFVIAAIQRYAVALEHDQDDILAAADEGIADIAAGRFEVISGPADMERLQAELTARLDQIEAQRGSTSR